MFERTVVIVESDQNICRVLNLQTRKKERKLRYNCLSACDLSDNHATVSGNDQIQPVTRSSPAHHRVFFSILMNLLINQNEEPGKKTTATDCFTLTVQRYYRNHKKLT